SAPDGQRSSLADKLPEHRSKAHPHAEARANVKIPTRRERSLDRQHQRPARALARGRVGDVPCECPDRSRTRATDLAVLLTSTITRAVADRSIDPPAPIDRAHIDQHPGA